MPFIGKAPETGAFRLIDSITTSATDTYALQVEGLSYFPASARNLIVSLNGVTQAPESAYTVSGSNIVFASALTASDVIDYILVIGDAVDIGTPSDNTVGNAQLKASLDFSGKTLTFSADQISGDAINGGTISSFASTGIDDNATSTAITIDSSQDVTFASDAKFPDNGKAIFGAGADLQINHDATNSVIDNFTGNLILRNYANDQDITVQSDNGTGGLTVYFRADGSTGSSILYHYGSKKIETTSGGIDVTGSIEATGDLTVDTNTLVVDSTNDRVGVNVSDPRSEVTVAGTAPKITLESTDTQISDGEVLGSLAFYSNDASGSATGEWARIDAVAEGEWDSATTKNGETNLAFYTTNNTGSPATAERMRISYDGNVGIGITNPTSGNLVVATDSRSLGGTITARTNFQGSGWVFGDVVGRFAFDADDGPQDYTSTIESVVSQGGNYPYKTDLIFTTQTNGNRTEKLRIQENGGISFNGDTAAVNALDDYEEGTWTPAFVNGTFTYVGQYGRYTKIGDTIIANASVQYSAKSGTGQTAISLPFTAQSNRFGVSLGYLAGLDNNQVQVSAGGNGGTNTILFWKIVNQGSPQQSLVQNMASSGEIQFSCVYQVAT